MIDQASVPSLMGSTVRDNAGEKIGKVGQVYLDDTTGQPEWVTVRTGLFGTKESFVPLAAARVEGDELVVDISKDRVHDAPRIDEDGHLSEEQETELYTYYGVSQGPFGRQTTPTAGGAPDEMSVANTYAGTETGRTGEGYPETDAGADYATTDGGTGVVPTDYDTTDRRTGVPTAGAAAGMAGGAATAASRFDDSGTPLSHRDAAVEADPTGTPVGDQDVAGAMSGPGFVESDETAGGLDERPDFARGEDASTTAAVFDNRPDFARGQDASVTTGRSDERPDFARGEDASVAGGVFDNRPDFARGEDASVAGGSFDNRPDFARGEDASVAGGSFDNRPDFARGEDGSVAGGALDNRPDFARGEDASVTTGGTAGAGERGADQPGGVRRRLRRWIVSDERSTTPVVDESGAVVGEVSTERVDMRPADEDETR